MSKTLYLNVFESVLGLIGATPLLRLRRIEDFFGIECKLYAKLEFYNPGGSVKDRIGLYMLRDAMEKGVIKPGGVIIEPTSGNTGIGLAIVSRIYGFRTVFTMPRKMSVEKELILKAYGGHVIRTPTEVPPDNPLSYYKVAEAIRNYISSLERPIADRELRDFLDYIQSAINREDTSVLEELLDIKPRDNGYAYIPNQYFNPANPKAHFETTGPEIWYQTNGEVDVFVAGMGTGGTISGASKYLKSKNPSIRVVGVDPVGSVYHHIKRGLSLEEAMKFVKAYKVEGIGEDILPETIDLELIDDVVVVDDQSSFSMARFTAKTEGLLIGGSSGSALYGAIKYIIDNGLSGKTVVVILPDTGRNYLTRFYSDEWMIKNGFTTDDETVLKSLKAR